MTEGHGLSHSFQALKNRNYRWYWLSGLGMTGAQGIQQLTLAWLVLDLTGSTGQLGLVIFMMGMPMTLMALFGGVIADRYDRKAILQFSQTFTSANLLILAVLSSTDLIEVWHLYLAAVGLGVMQALTMPARNALIQSLVSAEQRQNAVALNVMQMHASRIIWPSIAGVMIGTSGIGPTLAASAIASLFGIVCLSIVRSAPIAAVSGRMSPIAEIGEGIRYTFGHPLVGRVITLALCVATFGLAFMQLAPGFARQELDFSASTTGFFMMAGGIGAVIGSTALVVSRREPNFTRLLLFCAGFGLSLILLAINPWPAPSFLIMGLFGLSNAGILITAQSIFQVSVPHHMLGRAMSLFGIVGGLGSISALPVGAAGDEFGLRYSLGFVALILFVVTLLMSTGAQPLKWLGRPLDQLGEPDAEAAAGEGLAATSAMDRGRSEPS